MNMRSLPVIALLLLLLCVNCVIFPMLTMCHDGAIVWFKHVNGRHVELSRSGRLILAWSLNTLTLLTIDGDILFDLRVRSPSHISYATISPRGDIVLACYTSVIAGFEGEELFSLTVVAYDVNGGVVWNITEKGALNGRVVFSPSGGYVALLMAYGRGSGRKIALWLLTVNGSVLWRKTVYQGFTCEYLVCFTREGIVAAFNKRVVFLTINGDVVSVKKLTSIVKDADVSADGSLVAIIEHNVLHVYRGDGVELWNTSTGSILFYVDVSDNGRYVVTGGWKGAWCYDSNGSMLWSYVHGKDYVTPVAVSNNGYTVVADNSRFPIRIVLVGSDGITLWKQEVPRIGVCLSVDIAADASLVVAGDEYGLYLLKGKEYKDEVKPLSEMKVAIVTIVNKPPLMWVLNCSDRLRELQLLRNGGLLVVSEGWVLYVSSNGTLIWSKPVGPPLKALAILNGEYVVVASLRRVSLLNREGKELWTRLLKDDVKALTPLKNGIAVVTQSKVYIVNLKGEIKDGIKIPTPEMQEKSKPKDMMVYTGTPRIIAKVNPLGSLIALAYGYRSSVLTLIDTTNNRILWSIRLNTPIMDISLTNTKLILGLGNGTIIAVDLKEKIPLWKITLDGKRKAPILNIEVSEDEGYLTVNSKDGIIYLLKGSGELLWYYPRESGKELYIDIAISKDGKYIAAAGSHIVILDCNGRVIWKAKLPKKEVMEEVLSVTPDFKYLAVIVAKNTVQYYKIADILQQRQIPSQIEGEHIPITYVTLIALIMLILILLPIMLRRRKP